MKSKDKIWNIASRATERKCVGILQALFPTLANVISYADGQSVPTITPVSSKEQALRRLKFGLRSITDQVADRYYDQITAKERSTLIKY